MHLVVFSPQSFTFSTKYILYIVRVLISLCFLNSNCFVSEPFLFVCLSVCLSVCLRIRNSDDVDDDADNEEVMNEKVGEIDRQTDRQTNKQTYKRQRLSNVIHPLFVTTDTGSSCCCQCSIVLMTQFSSTNRSFSPLSTN